MKPNNFLRLSFSSLLIIFFLSVFSSLSTAQDNKYSEKDMPQKVMESFAKNYPKAEITGYDIDNENGNTIYEIESKEGNVQRDIEFTADGNIVEIGEFIDVNSLPTNVKQTISTKFNNAKILEAEMKTRGSVVSYEVVIKENEKNTEVLMNSNGNIIKDNESDDNEEGSEDSD